jgi:hypothetical protein
VGGRGSGGGGGGSLSLPPRAALGDLARQAKSAAAEASTSAEGDIESRREAAAELAEVAERERERWSETKGEAAGAGADARAVSASLAALAGALATVERERERERLAGRLAADFATAAEVGEVGKTSAFARALADLGGWQLLPQVLHSRLPRQEVPARLTALRETIGEEEVGGVVWNEYQGGGGERVKRWIDEFETRCLDDLRSLHGARDAAGLGRLVAEAHKWDGGQTLLALYLSLVDADVQRYVQADAERDERRARAAAAAAAKAARAAESASAPATPAGGFDWGANRLGVAASGKRLAATGYASGGTPVATAVEGLPAWRAASRRLTTPDASSPRATLVGTDGVREGGGGGGGGGGVGGDGGGGGGSEMGPPDDFPLLTKFISRMAKIARREVALLTAGAFTPHTAEVAASLTQRLVRRHCAAFLSSFATVRSDSVSPGVDVRRLARTHEACVSFAADLDVLIRSIPPDEETTTGEGEGEGGGEDRVEEGGVGGVGGVGGGSRSTGEQAGREGTGAAAGPCAAQMAALLAPWRSRYLELELRALDDACALAIAEVGAESIVDEVDVGGGEGEGGGGGGGGGGGVSDLTVPGSPGGREGGSGGGGDDEAVALVRTELVLRVLSANTEAVGRCLTLAPDADRASCLCHLFTTTVRFIARCAGSLGVRDALSRLRAVDGTAMGGRIRFTSALSVLLSSIQAATQLLVLVTAHFDKEVAPHLRSAVNWRTRCELEVDTTFSSLERQLSAGLEQSVALTAAVVTRTLASHRRREFQLDASADQTSLGTDCTTPCSTAITFVHSILAEVGRVLDGQNGTRMREALLGAVTDVVFVHYTKFMVTPGAGGVKLLRDVSEWRELVQTAAASTTGTANEGRERERESGGGAVERCDELRSVAQLYVVQSSQLAAVIENSPLAAADRRVVVGYLKKRTDFHKSMERDAF